jgi:hypothetical protein
MIETAAELSKKWHEGQVDKGGLPYWEHPARVARNVETLPGFGEFDEKLRTDIICAAYLHDVVEDCEITPDQLKDCGFSEDTIAAVQLLSKNVEFTTIEDYCARVKANPIARAVKLADLSDNCNVHRERWLRQKGIGVDKSKYPKVLAMLSPSAEEQSWFNKIIHVAPDLRWGGSPNLSRRCAWIMQFEEPEDWLGMVDAIENAPGYLWLDPKWQRWIADRESIYGVAESAKFDWYEPLDGPATF